MGLTGLSTRFPLIVFWNFNHFLVVEGIRKDKVYLNDPASGPRVVSAEEFDLGFTGVVVLCRPGPEFEKGGRKPSFLPALMRRLSGSAAAVGYLMLVGVAAVVIGMVIPAFSRVFVDKVLGGGQELIIPLLVGMGIAFTAVGASGGPGMTDGDSADCGPVPAALTAATLNAYAVPLVNPTNVYDVDVEPVGLDVGPVTPVAAPPNELYTVTW